MNIDPSHDDITQRARSLWEERGRPEGRDNEIWFDAENDLRRKSTQAGRSASAGPATSAEKARRAPRRNSAAPGANPTA